MADSKEQDNRVSTDPTGYIAAVETQDLRKRAGKLCRKRLPLGGKGDHRAASSALGALEWAENKPWAALGSAGTAAGCSHDAVHWPQNVESCPSIASASSRHICFSHDEQGSAKIAPALCDL